MKRNLCEQCEYYIPHYIKSKFLFISRVNCGHCYMKQKKSYNCQMFKDKQTNEDIEISLLSLILEFSKRVEKLNKDVCELYSDVKNFKQSICFDLSNKKEP